MSPVERHDIELTVNGHPYALSVEPRKLLVDALREDHEFLLEGGVFSPELIDAWIDYKIEHEVDPVRLRPHPHEFSLYYDI